MLGPVHHFMLISYFLPAFYIADTLSLMFSFAWFSLIFHIPVPLHQRQGVSSTIWLPTVAAPHPPAFLSLSKIFQLVLRAWFMLWSALFRELSFLLFSSIYHTNSYFSLKFCSCPFPPRSLLHRPRLF